MLSKTTVFHAVKAETLNISIHLISDQLLNRKKLQKQLSKTFNCTVGLPPIPDCAMLSRIPATAAPGRRMPFLPPNQQRQSTEGISPSTSSVKKILKINLQNRSRTFSPLWLLFQWVPTTYMLRQAALLTIRLWTLWTSVRFLSRVCPHVHCQIAGGSKRLSTLMTSVRFLSRVSSFVDG